MLTNEHQLLQRSNSTKHRINRVSGKKSICLKFVFWYFKYQLLQKIRIKIDESRVPKFYACRTYIFERLLSYVFSQISWFWSKLLANKQKSETPRSCGQKFENPRCKEMKENQIPRLIQNSSEISRLEDKFPRPWFFRVPFATPWYIFQSEHLWHNIVLTVYEKGNSCQINLY